jgi:hypothetical protein
MSHWCLAPCALLNCSQGLPGVSVYVLKSAITPADVASGTGEVGVWDRGWTKQRVDSCCLWAMPESCAVEVEVGGSARQTAVGDMRGLSPGS